MPLHDLTPESAVLNNRLAFDVLEAEFGVAPALDPEEVSVGVEKGKLVEYLSRVYHVLRAEFTHMWQQETREELLNHPEVPPSSISRVPSDRTTDTRRTVDPHTASLVSRSLYEVHIVLYEVRWSVLQS